MLKLQWPIYIWVCVIANTRCQLESNVNNFHLLKYPTEFSEYGFNKKPALKLCYHDHEDDTVAAQRTIHSPHSTQSNEHNAFLLKMFTNIVQQIRQRQCGNSKSSTTMSTPKQSSIQVDPEAETMATNGRSLRVYYKGQQPEEAEGTFDILEQLQLDEKKEQQQHNLKLASQQKPIEVQQEFWEDSSVQHQGKAGKKKKKKGKKKKKKKRKRKKKKPTKDKDKKKKKKKRKNKKKNKKQQTKPSFVGQPAHVLFASLSQKPQYQHQYEHHHPHTAPSQHVTLPVPITTTKPHHHFKPIKKIKYILRKNTIFKKKKKEYLNHLKHVLLPFVKFIAFFTVLNPFTLAVFLFSLISPVVFGFIGFIGLSFLIKPALNILFGVKRTVNTINRKNLLQKRKRERLRNSRRPITIHKHYYQQTRLPAPHRQPQRPNQQKHPHRHRHSRHFNPLLPHVKHKLKKGALFGPNFVRYEKITNGN